jgi:hypothetical protein
MSIAKTGRGGVPMAEADDTRRGRKGIHRLYDWGGERIGGVSRTGGNGTNRVALTIS